MKDESDKAKQWDPTVNEEHSSRGVAGTRSGLPTWFLFFTVAVATACGAAYDIPLSMMGNSGWFLRHGLVIVSLVIWAVVGRGVLGSKSATRPGIAGPVAIGLFVGLALVLYGIATVVGLGLQAVGVPLPFGLAGLFSGIVFAFALRSLRSRIEA